MGRSGKRRCKGLDAGALVGADHRAVCGRVDVEADDGSHLGVEGGITLALPVSDAMGLDGGQLEDPLHGAGADPADTPGINQGVGQERPAP